MFSLGCGALFAPLMAGGFAGGKAAAGAVILPGSAREDLGAQLRELQQEAEVCDQL